MVYITVVSRTVFFYVLLNFIYRIMGKREVGELSTMDFTLSILLSELAALAIDKYKSSIFLSLIPIIVLVLIEIIESRIIIKSGKTRKIFEGEPTVIINKGKLNFKSMLKENYNIHDLLTELRNNKIKSIDEVSYAILETNGKLSIFTKQGNNFGTYPLPLILDKEIDYNVLENIKKDKLWLEKTLKKENISKDEIFYAFYHNEKLFIIKYSDLK